jgi:hypothetical protein
MNLVDEVKKKKEFSGLPDSIVKRALVESNNDVKIARALLRKYFGVFLTNRILKGKGNLLKVHMSSKKRDYEKFYERIFGVIGDVKSVIDLGCGINGFSYEFFPMGIKYIGIEGAGQLVDLTNSYFKNEGFDAREVCLDLFDIDRIVDILKKMESPRVVFMFQVVDALENLERNFSKKFITDVSGECEWIVLSLSTESLGGRKKFMVHRKWIVDFLEENFVVESDFETNGERVLIFRKD